ncbi:MAG: hypothetical protein AB8B79_01880 [Granulosicoccus sp.]
MSLVPGFSSASVFLRLLLLLSILLLQACATSSALNVARDQFRHGGTSEALQTLAEADISRRDRLLLYLDTALIAQAAGNYVDSIEAFERAISLIDELDYVSARDQSAALLTNDWAIRYSGEYSERLWVHTFQMLNYLLLDSAQGAAVEARRAVELYEEFADVLKNDLFTRSLMAVSFDAAGQYDSAQVEYRKLAADFNLAKPERLRKKDSELILFVATGFIEPKLPGDLFIDYDARISFPFYPETYTNPPNVSVEANSQTLQSNQVDTTLVAISRSALHSRGKSVAARHALRLAAKYTVAEAIEDENELVGGLARFLLAALEQADTRSWETLPAYLSLIRVPMTAGEHQLTITIDGSDSSYSGVQQKRVIDLALAPGERHYQLIRTGVSSQGSPHQ